MGGGILLTILMIFLCVIGDDQNISISYHKMFSLFFIIAVKSAKICLGDGSS